MKQSLRLILKYIFLLDTFILFIFNVSRRTIDDYVLLIFFDLFTQANTMKYYIDKVIVNSKFHYHKLFWWDYLYYGGSFILPKWSRKSIFFLIHSYGDSMEKTKFLLEKKTYTLKEKPEKSHRKKLCQPTINVC